MMRAHAFVVGALALGEVSADKPCCKTCTKPLVKVFSTDAPHGFCGEACIDPARFDTFHKFEANLTIADPKLGDNPCAKQYTPSNTEQYGTYVYTETHGFPGLLSVTLDFYAPNDMPDKSCCFTPLIQSLHCNGIPGHPTEMTIFGMGPFCCPKGATEKVPCPKNVVSNKQEPDPNGLECTVCKSAVKTAVEKGVDECKALCKKAGSLDGVCESVCAQVASKCEGKLDCATKVCDAVGLCTNQTIVV